MPFSITSLARRAVALRAELAAFGAVGAIAFVIDVSTFNVARLLLHVGPLSSKVISVCLAAAAAYAGNRWWTYRHRRRPPLLTGFALFAVLNAGGLAIALGCLVVSHYVFGLTGPVADNVSGNGVGLALGTAFRFWAYPRFVFRRHPHAESSSGEPTVTELPREHPLQTFGPQAWQGLSRAGGKPPGRLSRSYRAARSRPGPSATSSSTASLVSGQAACPAGFWQPAARARRTTR